MHAASRTVPSVDLVAIDPLDVREAAAAHEQAYVELLADLVNRDSGSFDADLVADFARYVSGRLVARGWQTQLREMPPLHDGQPVGPMLDARLPGRRADDPDAPAILLLAHLDTVFNAGEAARRPFRIDERGHARGPGVTDNKNGIAQAIVVADVLRELGLDGYRELRLVCSPDEEIGSPSSRVTLSSISEEVDVSLCLEAARETGDIVTARKGVAYCRIRIKGRAAHAGVEPERGISAVHQAAHTTLALHALTGHFDGVTVNVGTFNGGTRANVVSAEAELHVELRAWDRATFDLAREELLRRARQVHVPGVEVEAIVLQEAPPMMRTPATAALAELVITDARRLGLAVSDARTGGAADANTTAAAGVPTLDGLGPIGGDDHAPSEWMDLASVVDRVALLGTLVARLGADGVAAHLPTD